MNVTTVMINLAVPEDTPIGADFNLLCDVRVVTIRDPQVLITAYGSKEETLRGEREYELQILNARLVPVV